MINKIKIGEKLIGENQPCFIIAEAGINHNGNIEKAMLLIQKAAEAGADAIKFQTHLPEKEMLKDGFTAEYVKSSLFDLLKKVELSKKDHINLKKYAEKKGILFLSTPFSREAADLLEKIGVNIDITEDGGKVYMIALHIVRIEEKLNEIIEKLNKH